FAGLNRNFTNLFFANPVAGLIRNLLSNCFRYPAAGPVGNFGHNDFRYHFTDFNGDFVHNHFRYVTGYLYRAVLTNHFRYILGASHLAGNTFQTPDLSAVSPPWYLNHGHPRNPAGISRPAGTAFTRLGNLLGFPDSL